MSRVKYRTLQVTDKVDFTDCPEINIGTLSSLTASQATIAILNLSATNAIAASETQTQAASTALVSDINRVTTATETAGGVSLPTATSGRRVLIINAATANSLQVWPGTGDKIDDQTVNAAAATLMGVGSSREFIAVDTTNWYTVP